MANKSSIPQLTLPKDTSSNLASVSDFGNLSNPMPNEEAPFLGRRIQLFPKNGFSSDNTSRSLVKSTSLYKRTLACGNSNIKIGEFIDVKLKDIQNKNGIDRANAILDLGRNGVLLEGQELDDETVDSIISVLFSLLDDPSWEVRMDALWLIDVLREEGYLDGFDFVEFEKELVFRNKSKENDTRVMENARKLSSNLRLQRVSIASFQAAQEKELNNQKVLTDYLVLKEELVKTKETNVRLKSENLTLLKQNNEYAEANLEKSTLADHIGNQNIDLQKSVQKAQKDLLDANGAKAELQRKFDLQAEELNTAAVKHQDELREISIQFEEAKAAKEILEKINLQQQMQIQELFKRNQSLAQELQIQLRKNTEQAQIICEKVELVRQLYIRSDSLQNALEEVQENLSILQTTNLSLQNQAQHQTEESKAAVILHQQEMQRITAQLQEMKSSNKSLEQTNRAQSTQILNFYAALSDRDEKLEQALLDMATLAQKAQEESDKNEECIRLLNTQNDERRNQFEQSQEKLVILEKSNLDLKSEFQLRSEELAGINRRDKEELDQVRVQLEKMKAEYEGLRKSNALDCKQIEVLQASLASQKEVNTIHLARIRKLETGMKDTASRMPRVSRFGVNENAKTEVNESVKSSSLNNSSKTGGGLPMQPLAQRDLNSELWGGSGVINLFGSHG